MVCRNQHYLLHIISLILRFYVVLPMRASKTNYLSVSHSEPQGFTDFLRQIREKRVEEGTYQLGIYLLGIFKTC